MSGERLHIFTGKGGVGKTSMAMAYTLFLKQKNQNVFYINFNEENNLSVIDELGLPTLALNIVSSAENYIERKLHSKIIAKFVMQAPFFKALFNIVPSLGSMIMLGHILKQLEEDPSMVLVLDAPASGHSLSMFESSHQFQTIFRKGIIVDDIENMHRYLYDSNFCKIFIISTVSRLSLEEAQELKQEMQNRFHNIDSIYNFSYLKFIEKINESHRENSTKLNIPNLPSFLREKINFESELFYSLKVQDHHIFSLSISNRFVDRVHDLFQHFQLHFNASDEI